MTGCGGWDRSQRRSMANWTWNFISPRMRGRPVPERKEKLSGRMQYSAWPRRQRMSSARETGYPNEIQYGNAEIISRPSRPVTNDPASCFLCITMARSVVHDRACTHRGDAIGAWVASDGLYETDSPSGFFMGSDLPLASTDDSPTFDDGDIWRHAG